MNVPTLTLAILSVSLTMFAADPVAQMYQDQLRLVENDVVSLSRAMPEEKYGFAPSQGEFKDVRTFGEQIKHLATMIFMTAAMVREERSPYGPGPNNNGPAEIRTKAEILKYLDESISYARGALATLTIENHLQPARSAFGAMPRSAVAAGIAFHSYNHYGQMVVYARMNGIVPPTSVPSSPQDNR